MADSLTISAVVDETVRRTARPDKRLDIAAYVNSTVRECQALGFFFRDLIEDSILATASPHIWERPNLLRRLKAINYGDGIVPVLRPPSRMQQRALETPYYFYAASNYYVFAGVEAQETLINIAYYARTKRLGYVQTEAQREATFDTDTGEWTYLTAVTDEEQEAARAKVTNWVIFSYYDCVLEGTMAKLLKSVNDEKRSLSSFALYKSLQKEITINEILESIDVSGDANAI